ncbi:MAG: hypothetical protein ACRD2N_24900 [Vicinamibacterales bacterium]
MPENPKDPKTLLAEAIRKRDELNTFIKVLQEMSGAAVSETTEASNASTLPNDSGEISDPLSLVYPGMFFGKSQPQAAEILLERVKRPIKTRVLVEAFRKGGSTAGGKQPAINLWGTLNRNEKFVLVPKAGWGLRSWYDAKTLARMGKAIKESDEDAGDAESTEA